MNEIYKVLKRAYGPYIPYPLDIYWYDWKNDNKFGGSFPSFKVGITHSDIVTLKTNIERLFFAGDWQSEHYTGCLHAAYFSAYDRTQDLIAALHNHWNIDYKEFTPNPIVDMCLRQSDSLC